MNAVKEIPLRLSLEAAVTNFLGYNLRGGKPEAKGGMWADKMLPLWLKPDRLSSMAGTHVEAEEQCSQLSLTSSALHGTPALDNSNETAFKKNMSILWVLMPVTLLFLGSVVLIYSPIDKIDKKVVTRCTFEYFSFWNERKHGALFNLIFLGFS